MIQGFTSALRKFDWILFGACVLLVGFGLTAIYSTSLGTGQASGDFLNFWKQLAFAAAGIGIALVTPTVNYRMLSGLSKFLYAAGIALLVAVLVFGQTIRGTTGWFSIGGFGIQPVELVKLFLVVALAKFFADYGREPSGMRPIVRSGALVAAVVALVVLQPDFGSAILLVGAWGALLLMTGVKRSHLLLMLAAAVLAAAVGWAFILKPYQQDRIAVFLDPSRDPLGKGYNVTQSVIAIGSGGFIGKGIGFGSQSQLRFLPERQTDFIFAVVAEELGFLGVLFILGLFAVVFYRGYLLAVGARDDFTLFLVLGILVSFALEAFVNIGGNLRLLPVTGVTLPFISYGGSSLLVKFLMVGVLESVAVRR